ncbi:hypothetical protein CEQ28_023300 [Hafnia alvei]|nr:hypothetical protein CEQ28_023300 [Hafnia alvei]
MLLLGYDCSLASGTHWHGNHVTLRNPDATSVSRWHEDMPGYGYCFPSERDQLLASVFAAGVSTPAARGGFVTYLFDGMHGLGDNIYQRAFMRFYPEITFRTPWPELYQD